MHALIIGGGIAGPAVGIALRKAGHEATVFEAYPTLTAEVGYFLTLAGNGLDGLSVLGADAAVREAAFPTPRMVFRNGAGKVLAVAAAASGSPIPLPGADGRRDGSGTPASQPIAAVGSAAGG